MARIGRWLLGIGGGLVLGLILVWAALPALTVALVHHQTPLAHRGTVVQGMAWTAPPDGPGTIVATLPPEQAWTLATAASGQWFPRRCLAVGQTLWGQAPGGLPWRLALTAEPARVVGRPRPDQVAALIAAHRPSGAPWDVGVHDLTLTSQPAAAGDLARLAVSFRGHLNVAGFQLEIDRLEGEVRLLPGVSSPEAQVTLTTLRLIGGDGEALRVVLAGAASSAVTKALRQAPSWVPWQAVIDVRVGTATVEL